MHDEKFLDGVILDFNKIKDVESEYYIWNKNGIEDLHYIKNQLAITGFIPYGSEMSNELFQRCRQLEFDGVIFHSIPDNWGWYVDGLGLIPRTIVTWGFELYSFIGNTEFLLDETLKWIKNRQTVKSRISEVYHKIKKKFFISETYKIMFHKMNALSPVFSKDYELLHTYYPKLDLPPMVMFQYGSTERLQIYSTACEESGDSILINHSATKTGNHFDVLKMLHDKEFNGNIVLPLSYGNKTYGNDVAEYGRKLFGDKITILSDFIPYSEYSRIISKCSSVIMGHLRQQALGNITCALLAGKKVFLLKNSVIYKEYKSCGFDVFPFEDAQSKDFLQPVSNTQKENNLQKISKYWSEKLLFKRYGDLITFFDKTNIFETMVK